MQSENLTSPVFYPTHHVKQLGHEALLRDQHSHGSTVCLYCLEPVRGLDLAVHNVLPHLGEQAVQCSAAVVVHAVPAEGASMMVVSCTPPPPPPLKSTRM